MRLEPGGAPELSLPDGEVRSQIIAPGAAFTVRIDYAPLVSANHFGAVELSISSARSPFSRVPISGSGAQATLLIVPHEIDFSSIGVGRTTPARTVQVYYTSSTPTVIRSIRPAALGNLAFTITRLPTSLPGAPASIPPGQSADFAISFHADALSRYAGAGRGPGHLRRPSGHRSCLDAGQRFTHGRATRPLRAAQRPQARRALRGRLSGSMAHEQAAVAAHFCQFLRFAEAQALDYQVGVISSVLAMGGRLFRTHRVRGHGFGGPLADRCATPPTTPDPEMVFTKNLQAVHLRSGIVDAGQLYASYLALTPPITTGPNTDFLRPDALLSAIYLSDEPDACHLLADAPGGDVGFSADFLRSIKGSRNTNLLSASAVIAAPQWLRGSREARRSQARAMRNLRIAPGALCTPSAPTTGPHPGGAVPYRLRAQIQVLPQQPTRGEQPRGHCGRRRTARHLHGRDPELELRPGYRCSGLQPLCGPGAWRPDHRARHCDHQRQAVAGPRRPPASSVCWAAARFLLWGSAARVRASVGRECPANVPDRRVDTPAQLHRPRADSPRAFAFRAEKIDLSVGPSMSQPRT